MKPFIVKPVAGPMVALLLNGCCACPTPTPTAKGLAAIARMDSLEELRAHPRIYVCTPSAKDTPLLDPDNEKIEAVVIKGPLHTHPDTIYFWCRWERR